MRLSRWKAKWTFWPLPTTASYTFCYPDVLESGNFQRQWKLGFWQLSSEFRPLFKEAILQKADYVWSGVRSKELQFKVASQKKYK